MLEVIINLVPHGREAARTELGRLVITNTLTHPNRPQYGNYAVYDEDRNLVGEVSDYDRSLGFWELVKQVLQNSTLNEKDA